MVSCLSRILDEALQRPTSDKFHYDEQGGLEAVAFEADNILVVELSEHDDLLAERLETFAVDQASAHLFDLGVQTKQRESGERKRACNAHASATLDQPTAMFCVPKEPL